MSIPMYYDRIEQTALGILEERERKPKYYITLWWGFDGLREGEDGKWAWVSRRKKEISFVPPLTSLPNIWCDPRQFMCTQMQNAAQSFPQEQGGPDATIARLKVELANMNRNIVLNEQQKRLAAMISQCCTNNLNRGLW